MQRWFGDNALHYWGLEHSAIVPVCPLHMQHCTQHQISAKCQYIFPPWRMFYLVLFMCLWARQSRGCSLTFHNATCSQCAGPEFLQCHVELCSAMQRYAVQSNNCRMDSYSGLKGSPVRTGRLYVRNSALISVATTQTKHTTQLDMGILSAY